MVFPVGAVVAVCAGRLWRVAGGSCDCWGSLVGGCPVQVGGRRGVRLGLSITRVRLLDANAAVCGGATTECRSQIRHEGQARGWPVGGLFGHGPRQHVVDRWREVRSAAAHGRYRAGQVRPQHGGLVLGQERRVSGQRLIQHAAQRVDVGGGADGSAADLFRRDVMDGAEEVAGGGQIGHGRPTAWSSRSR